MVWCFDDPYLIDRQTSAMRSNGGYRKGVTEAKIKVAINGFGRISLSAAFAPAKFVSVKTESGSESVRNVELAKGFRGGG
jgi:hypothetical protein